MTDIRNVGQEVQAEMLKTVRKGQESVAEAIRIVAAMTPALPDLNRGFASKLPKPEELAGNAYSLAMRILADQRKFAEDVLHTTGRLFPRGSGASAGQASAARKAGTSGTSRTGGTGGTSRTGGTAKKAGSGK